VSGLLRTIWKFLLMFNGVSSDEDERGAAAPGAGAGSEAEGAPDGRASTRAPDEAPPTRPPSTDIPPPPPGVSYRAWRARYGEERE